MRKLFVSVLAISAAFLCLSCDDTGSKKVTSITNNTTEVTEIQDDPELSYEDVSDALDTDTTITEVCKNNQVMLVVTAQTTITVSRPFLGMIKKERTGVVSVMYKLDKYGRPIQCGIPE